MTEFAAVILAAGKGTRMKSDLHKVLHPIAGRSMLHHLMASVDALSPAHKVVVVGAGREQLETALGDSAKTCLQEPQHGTGHAVQQAREALSGFSGAVLVMYGDVPFVRPETMQAMLDRLEQGDAPAAVVLGFEPEDAGAYGRVLTDGEGRISKMVEYKDADDVERACTLCNSGLMAARADDLFALLDRVGNDNAQGEYYLPDIVNIALADGRTCAAVTTDARRTKCRASTAAVNSPGQRPSGRNCAARTRWQRVLPSRHPRPCSSATILSWAVMFWWSRMWCSALAFP